MLLSVDDSRQPVGPTPTGFTAAVPFEGWGSTLLPATGRLPDHGAAAEITDSELPRLLALSEGLARPGAASIVVALDRVLAASAQRISPADVLLDSVTAWENLVGAGDAESTFRATAALAWMLAPDNYTIRAGLAKQLRAVYHDRSVVIHGGPRNGDTVAQSAGLALHIARQTLRLILTEHRWLVDLGGSRLRSDAILIGDDRFRPTAVTELLSPP